MTMILDFIILCLVFCATTVGTVYLILDIKNLDSERNKAEGKDELPYHLKISFGLYLAGFLLLILLNIF